MRCVIRPNQSLFRSIRYSQGRRMWQNVLKKRAFSAEPVLTIGIPSETYDPWERRAPLTPDQVHELLTSSNHRLAFHVQPSGRRVFADHEYEAAGAKLVNDLSASDIIMGVKRPLRESALLNDKTYLFFSHTIKGQPANMKLLQECLKRNIQLIDYERITAKQDNQNKSKRLVSFGRFAGIAGAMDTLQMFGKKLLCQHGCSSPFLTFPPAIMHDCLDDARARVVRTGERLLYEGIRTKEPVVFAITGRGGCAHGGAMEILQMLPHEIVPVPDLPELVQQSSSSSQHKIYLAPVDIADVFQKLSPEHGFDRDDFLTHPSNYRSQFAKRVAKFSTVLINCAYWDARFPRLLTKRQMKKLYEEGHQRLSLVTDISCDVNGSIEFLERSTSIGDASFQYDPILQCETDAGLDKGITVMGVDILPAELPRESSAHFGDALSKVVLELAHAKEQQSDEVAGVDTSLLSPGLSDACITSDRGQLMPGFQYLKTLMHREHKGVDSSRTTMVLSLDGHVFDSGLINQVLDVVEMYDSGVQFLECLFPPQSGRESSKSHVVLKIDCPNEQALIVIEQKIHSLVAIIEKADASVCRIDKADVDCPSTENSSVDVESPRRTQRVLLLGAGRVSRSFVEYLGRSGDCVITVVSDNEEEARRTASAAQNGQHECFDVANSMERLSLLIEDSDIVASLLPAPMHPSIAAECIMHSTDLVTASYESEEMRSMEDRIRAANIVVLNEVGLDPGLDHMSAMKIIDSIKGRGGRVSCFSSVCGGLPAPEAANNPFKYKFSWSPRGVISACQNGARYMRENVLVEVQGKELLHYAAPFIDAWNEFELECLPNRDSFKYERAYGISGASTLFRGTLRYRGFSILMNTFQNLGLFDGDTTFQAHTWAELIEELRARRGGFANVEDFVLACADDDREEADRALQAMRWLGMLGREPVKKSISVVDAFCAILEKKLVYEEGEHDMVLMHHTIDGTFDDGSVERHHSTLQVFGDDSMTAMSKTVGFTTAASVELVLKGGLKGRSGLVLPTDPVVYSSLLDRLELEGIKFNESTVSHHTPVHQRA